MAATEQGVLKSDNHDEALEETFPASDPASTFRPRQTAETIEPSSASVMRRQESGLARTPHVSMRKSHHYTRIVLARLTKLSCHQLRGASGSGAFGESAPRG
jgi:hypothetical protein